MPMDALKTTHEGGNSKKIQSIDDLAFEVVKDGDPDFATALSVLNTNGEQSEQELLEKARQ